jgi:hypothetical protein
MNRSALTEEAFQALLRLKQGMYAVAVAASELGSSYDRVVLKLILRNESADAFEHVDQHSIRRISRKV